MRIRNVLVFVGLLTLPAGAQSIVFDFENAQGGSGLPLSLTVGGLQADFSASGLGGFFVQQPQSAALPTPAGFSGYCLLPSSNDSADLHVAFSQPLTDFAILYSPQELACDASATMQLSAYLNGTLVGTSTTNATAQCTCTWASEWLRFSSAQGFNSIVVHYVAPAAGCQDYGRIYMADNVTVTVAPPPIILSNVTKLANGALQFTFANTPNAPCTVFGATNPSLPFSSWTTVTGLTEAPPGQYQFVDWQATNVPRRFYRVHSP
jgi:hypothetical protein